MKRQFDSSLYKRLALRKDRDKVAHLALEGQTIESPEDAIKALCVLEFLGLPELPEYSETELKTKIIDHLQKFLLELGTGFAFIGGRHVSHSMKSIFGWIWYSIIACYAALCFSI